MQTLGYAREAGQGREGDGDQAVSGLRAGESMGVPGAWIDVFSVGSGDEIGGEEAMGRQMNTDEIQVGGNHYKQMAMQPWDVMEAVMTRHEYIGFLKGNIIKYAMRAGQKEGSEDDAQKALHYRQKLREVMGSV